MRLVETVNRGEIIKSFLDGYLALPHYSPFYSHFLFHVKQKGKPELPLVSICRDYEMAWFFGLIPFSDCFT